MNDTGDFVQEFGKDFTLSLENFRELFFKKSDNGIGIPGILAIIIGALAFIIVGSLVLRLIKYLFGRKKRLLSESRFLSVKKYVLKQKMEDINQEQLEQLIDKGLELMKKVDKYTGRNYGTDVPILVYRISNQLNLGSKNSSIFFIASFFYDCGFLEIPQEYFWGEILNRKEKSMFKKHVITFQDQLPSIPKGIYDEVFNACSFHHENFDGTGYPEGLSGENIPMVARIIRVVESYMSLTSKQSYHRGLSKKRAIKVLQGMSKIYDQTVVDVLETLV